MGIFNRFRKKNQKNNPENMPPSDIDNVVLPKKLKDKMSILNPYLNKSFDIKIRNIEIDANKGSIEAAVIFMDNIIETGLLHQNILEPLMSIKQMNVNDQGNMVNYIYKKLLNVGIMHIIGSPTELVHAVFDGFVILVVNGCSEALVINISGGETRSISEPVLDKTVLGVREGFVENLRVNISLIRRKLKDPSLVIEKRILGRRTRTDVAVMYIEDIADNDVVKEVFKRIDGIDIDGIIAIDYINQFLDDNPHSLFQLSRKSERPDIIVAGLLEGRVVIMADQSPIALMFPSLFIEQIQATEDYFLKSYYGTFIRLIRVIALLTSILLPGLFISLVNFRPELIPFKLIVSLAEYRRDVPFPVIAEILLLELVIILIFEAGLHLPSSVGQTIGVVAGIVLGQALISAKLASPAVIILGSLTAISSFSLPNFSLIMTSRIIRLLLIFICSILGLYGFSFSIIILLTHLSKQESMGVPYFAPLAPTRYADLKDSFFRGFIQNMKNRPVSIPTQDKKRQKDNKNAR